MFTSKRVLLRTIERMQHDHAAHIAQLVEVIARLSGKPLPQPARPAPAPQQQREPDGFVDV